MNKFTRTNSSLLEKNIEINFEFNGAKYKGFQGDTLASALLANNIILIGRSFKYHRPRGIFPVGLMNPML